MQPSPRRKPGFIRLACAAPALALMLVPACRSTLPSAELKREVGLPIPPSAMSLPDAERLSLADRGEHYRLSPRSLIPIAFARQPDIKSSFQRFKSEEARYDFFFASRDSLTPRLRVLNAVDEARADKETTRQRDHSIELGVEKRFFDTTRIDIGVGFRAEDTDDDIGSAPFISADLRYPLWASREKLERTSEDIFRRNELDDVQLAYIQEIRQRLQFAMFRFYEVVDLRRRVGYLNDWLTDLNTLVERFDGLAREEVDLDRSRVAAEITRVTALRREADGRFQVELTRLKAACGLPFHARIELVNEQFNPFAGQTHQELLGAAIETDPEIATLRNAERNAEVQLDLARRGRWDIALLLAGQSQLEGHGADDGVSDWSVSVGFDVSAVDVRVTESLSRQAQANIFRFQQAIAAREDAIFADTFEPLIRIETLSANLKELLENLRRFEDNYSSGVTWYMADTLNIDDLLKRREILFDQQKETSRLRFLVGANVAELCAATGKFFELLDEADTP